MTLRGLRFSLVAVLALGIFARDTRADLLDEGWKRGNEAHWDVDDD